MDDLIIPDLSKKPVAVEGHKRLYDPTCVVCKNPYRTAIELDFEQPMSLSMLSGIYSIPVPLLRAHMHALDLDVARLNNTDKTAARILDEGLKALDEGTMDVTADHLLRIGEFKDKKEGRVINRVEVTKPSVIVFRNLPKPNETLALSEAELEAPVAATMAAEDSND